MKSGLPTFAVRVALTLVLVAGALYALLDPALNNDVQKWAAGMLGSLVTYWFSGRAH
jgi:hypothetical protein